MTEEINQPEKNRKNDFRILGFNILAVVIYMLASRVISEDGLILGAIVMVIHAFVALILSVVLKSWMWFLTSVMIVIVGFSTCVFSIGPLKIN